MFRKVSAHFTRLAPIVLFCLGLALHAPAQDTANPPPKTDEPRAALADVVIHVNQVAYD